MKKTIIIIVAVLVVAAAAVYFFVIPKPPEPPKKSSFVPGDFFVTNIKNSKALLKVSVVLEVNKGADDKEFHEFLTENTHVIRDIIVFTLREKTEEELRSSDIQEQLRKEFIAKINEKLGIDNVQAIYFNDYVLQ